MNFSSINSADDFNRERGSTFLWGILFSVVLTFYPATSYSQDSMVIQGTEVVGFGIFEPGSSRRSMGFGRNHTAMDMVGAVKFTESTSTVPGVLGKNFGFKYRINSTPRGGKMRVTTVITFPAGGLVRPNGKVYQQSRDISEITIGKTEFSGFGFDEHWEIVPGEWKFEIWHGRAKLVQKTFTVVMPNREELVQEFAGA